MRVLLNTHFPVAKVKKGLEMIHQSDKTRANSKDWKKAKQVTTEIRIRSAMKTFTPRKAPVKYFNEVFRGSLEMGHISITCRDVRVVLIPRGGWATRANRAKPGAPPLFCAAVSS